MNSLPLRLAALFWIAAATCLAAAPAKDDHWVATWATASYPDANAAPTPSVSTGPGLGAFAASDETLREIVHISIGGPSVRVSLSNAFGNAPLQLRAATVALSAGGSNVRPESVHPLLFGGKPATLIPAGASVLSDPVELRVEPLSDLAISLYLPAQPLAILTIHGNASQRNFRAAGNAVSQPSLSPGNPFLHYVFLKEVEVLAPAQASAIVAFGDSITDGTYVTPNSNMRWPDELSRRLQADKHTRNLAVVNEGIGGNRVLHDGTGPNALARLGPDVLDIPGVRFLVVLEAINDIGRAYQPQNPYDFVRADDLIQAYQQIIARAHQHGIKVIGATLTPYMGAGYSSPAGEQVRSTVNQWIRGAGHFDAVIDFDAVTRDPANPTTFKPTVDHGDHLHPGDAGYKLMGDSVDLSLFQ